MEAEREDDLVVGRETCECALDQVAFLGGAEGIGIRQVGRQLGRAGSGRAPEPVPAGVDEDAPEPRLEAGLVPKARPGAPGAQERVVDHILGIGAVTEDQTGEAVAAIEMAGSKVFEGGSPRRGAGRLLRATPRRRVCHAHPRGRRSWT